jgi:hypothetical protein
MRGRDRLLFPTGTFAGTWTRDEIVAAVASGDARIEHVTSAIIWEREERVLAPFMERFWSLRSQYGKRSPEGRWLKWLVNSLTGKLAMRPEGERCIGAPRPGEIKRCHAAGPCFGVACGRIGTCCPHKCIGECGRWSPLNPDLAIWSAPEYRVSDCAHVQWAATLTASTRIELREQALSVGDDFAYCDTDSVKATRRITRRIGTALGEWSDEGWYLDWYAPAPKAYRAADAETGEYVTKSKGLSKLDAIRFDAWALGEPVRLDRGVWGLKGGARRGAVFAKRDISRARGRFGRVIGSRIALDDGRTRPMSWAEYQAFIERGELR